MFLLQHQLGAQLQGGIQNAGLHLNPTKPRVDAQKVDKPFSSEETA